MATYRAQVSIPFFTMLPGDVMTNTFHFTEMTPLGLEAVADAVTPLLEAFYETIYNGSMPMASYMNGINASVNWYDLSQPTPRAPYHKPMPLTVVEASTGIPTEVACVLSFQGAPVSGVPQARRRGRIYLGAVTEAWLTSSANDAFPRFQAADITNIANAANTLRTASATASARWSVWSQVDQEAVLIETGWVDNSPDTQRRRSVDSSSRTLWP